MRQGLQTLRHLLPALMVSLLLISCAGEQKKDEVADGPSESDITASDVADAIPRPEPRARYGNHSPYEVFGKQRGLPRGRYSVLVWQQISWPPHVQR